MNPVQPRRLSEYGAPSAMSEAVLVRGYAGEIVTWPCLCGGSIRARAQEIAEAVLVHNRSTAHAAWAMGAGWR